jgi:hypothetical protein
LSFGILPFAPIKKTDASKSKPSPVLLELLSHPNPTVNFGASILCLCPFSKLKLPFYV